MAQHAATPHHVGLAEAVDTVGGHAQTATDHVWSFEAIRR